MERRLLKLGRMYFGLRLDEVIKFIFLFSVKKGAGFQSSPEINISFYVKFWCEMRGGGEDNTAFPFSFGKCFWVLKKVFLWSSAACWYAVIELWFYLEVESIWFLDKRFQKKSALAEATVSIKARAGLPGPLVGAPPCRPPAWRACCAGALGGQTDEARPLLGSPRRCRSASVSPGIGLLPWWIFVIIHLEIV